MTPTTDASLQKALARYAVPRRGRAISNLLTSVAAYLGLIGASCVALRLSPWIAAGLSTLAAGFLLRTFIVFHDCAHGSFLPSKRTNALLGAALGVLVYTPFALLYHHESGTRGRLHPPKDEELVWATWGDVIRRGDPYYNPNLTLSRTDWTLS